jgi:hypothetical protein
MINLVSSYLEQELHVSFRLVMSENVDTFIDIAVFVLRYRSFPPRIMGFL